MSNRTAMRNRLHLHGPARIDATGTRRRLQALSVLGWSMRALSEQCSVSRLTLVELLSGKTTSVFRRTAAAVATTFDELWNVPATGPQAAQTRSRALAKGWAPPMAWDEIDDPRDVPAGEYKPRKRRSSDEVAQEHTFLRKCGLTDDDIAQRLDMKTESLLRALERHEEAA